MKIKFSRYSKLFTLIIGSSLLWLSSCKKEDEPERELSTAGVYVLCEGGFAQGNSDISYYNINTGATEKNYYKKVNGSALGETANDLQRYGSKMYCVITGIQGTKQSFVDVIDVKTCKSIKRIAFNSATDGYLPRNIAFYQNKAYVSRYDGKVSRIDTATLSIDGEITLSEGLDGLAVANGKLYIANSDYYLYPNGKKNVVSVVDLLTFTKNKDITVTHNPVKVAAAPTGDVYVVCAGDYNKLLPALDKISSVTDTKVQSITDFSDYSSIAITGSSAYVSTDPYTNAVIRPLDLNTGKPGANFVTDGTAIKTIYGLTIDPLTNDLYVGDANNYNATTGRTYCFGANGKAKFSFETAGNPQRAVFIYNYK